MVDGATVVQASVALAVPAVGVIVWLVRLEGRIDKQAALNEALREDLAYVRSRIDAALNGHLR